MDRTTAPGNVNGRFVAEDLNTGRFPTELDVNTLNAWQDELINVIVDYGLVPDANDKRQISKAIARAIAGATGIYFGAGPDIGDSDNLNNYIKAGFYHQNSNAQAASGFNYPIAYAGMLEVFSDGRMVYQRYTTYNSPTKVFVRTRYTGSSDPVWLPWSSFWSSQNDGHGSGLDADTLDGKHGADYVLSSDFKSVLESAFNANDPVGTKKYVSSTASLASCWVICDGRTYVDSSGVTRTSPNLTDTFIIGSGGSVATTVGSFVGSNDAVVVSHSHSITDPGHNHTISSNSNSDALSGKVAVGGDPSEGVAPTTDSKVTGISVNTTGVSGVNKNIPASYVQIVVMKFRLYRFGD